MDIRGWDQRYRSKERSSEDFDAPATPLIIETAKQLKPGKALDLACGTGRNALWLAKHGWSVTAVDASSAAIETLGGRASHFGLNVMHNRWTLKEANTRLSPQLGI
jgi:2-polyprenyl-3-methyl-5-hydroxy-6-metoxy-1,4-benzoquinol methylase